MHRTEEQKAANRVRAEEARKIRITIVRVQPGRSLGTDVHIEAFDGAEWKSIEVKRLHCDERMIGRETYTGLALELADGERIAI